MSGARLPEAVIDLGQGFYNIRGSFRKLGFLDIGTQASLVRLESGDYVMLDACSLDAPTAEWLGEITDGGARLAAVVHVHPFHTVFVREMHERYPKVPLYGTRRHHEELGDLPWEPERSEDPALHERFAGDLELTVPAGVELVPADPKLHFSSVLVLHPASKTLHVDDTLTYTRLPKLLRPLMEDVTAFHPTLAKVLERRAGAAADFRDWAKGLIERTRDIDNLCAAHTSALIGAKNRGASVAARIEAALAKVEPKLAAHERRYG